MSRQSNGVRPKGKYSDLGNVARMLHSAQQSEEQRALLQDIMEDNRIAGVKSLSIDKPDFI